MKCWRQSFNIYLLAGLLVSGCGAGGFSSNKDYSALRVYEEGRPGDGTEVHVGRDRIPIYVKAEPMLTEEDVAGAKLVDNPDGTYSIAVKFGDHGRIVLNMNTTAGRGRHLIFFCQLKPKSDAADQPIVSTSLPWVSMLMIRTGITGGTLEFTPDTSHDEAEQIVRGINNMVSQLEKMGN